MFLAATIVSSIGGFYTTRPCAQIASIVGQDMTSSLYPSCLPFFQGRNNALEVVVEAGFPNDNLVEIGAGFVITFGSAGFVITFGSAGWLASRIHALATEFYLDLTPAESQRLRQISYERQLGREFRNPGSAGLVAQQLGGAHPYVRFRRLWPLRLHWRRLSCPKLEGRLMLRMRIELDFQKALSVST